MGRQEGNKDISRQIDRKEVILKYRDIKRKRERGGVERESEREIERERDSERERVRERDRDRERDRERCILNKPIGP